jgi:hypothetical protein
MSGTADAKALLSRPRSGPNPRRRRPLASRHPPVLTNVAALMTDALGWILYNRGVYQRAVALLKESASKLPEAPEVQYHLEA